MRLLSWKKVPHPVYPDVVDLRQYRMEVETGFLWFKGARTIQGDCTVWHYWPSGKSCGLLLCSKLRDIEQAIQFKEAM